MSVIRHAEMLRKISAERMIAQAAGIAPIADLTVESTDVEQMIADMYRELQL